MGHIACPICDHGSFVNLKLFKKCVGSALSRPMCCLVCKQTVLGLTSLHVHLSQHESGSQVTPSRDSRREVGLQTIRPDDANSPLSDDSVLPESCLGNLYLGRSLENSVELNVQEPQSNEMIPPLDKLDLQDSPLCLDLAQESKEESSTLKFTPPRSDALRSSSQYSVTDSRIDTQTNSPSSSSQYSCDECGLMFSSQHFLAWHKDIIHKHSDYFEVSCKLCKMKFPSLETYRNHVRENHYEQRYLCEKCPKTFKLRGSLVVHRRMYHDGTPSICQLCHKKFPSDTRRDLHERRHHSSCGKATTKGKFSQDVEASLPLKKTLNNNSIEKVCRKLDNLIQRSACQTKFPETFLSSSVGLNSNNLPALSMSATASSQMSFSDGPTSLHARTHSTNKNGIKFKSEIGAEKSDAVTDQHLLLGPIEDTSGELGHVSRSTSQSSESRMNLVDIHPRELLQNVETVLEKPHFSETSSGKFDDILQRSDRRNTNNKKNHNSPGVTADTINMTSLPHCLQKNASVPSSSTASSSSKHSQIEVSVASASEKANTSVLPHGHGSKMEFCSSAKISSPGNQPSLLETVSKPEHNIQRLTSPERNAHQCCDANDLQTTQVQNTRNTAAESSNLKEMKKDFNRNHQNQKVGLPAFLGCDGKSWECDVCKKCFTTKYFLKKHKRLHTGETPYTCSECGKTFTFQQSYHKHLLYHSDEKPHVCAYCGRAFKEMSTLHNHVRIHTGEKPFVCDTCGKAFRQRVSYLVHQRIHTGVLPYTCHECHKSFRYKVSLRSHKCEKTGKESPSTSTNLPMKEARSESDDSSLRSVHPTKADFGKKIEEKELNFSETQLENVLFRDPSNAFGLTLAAQSEISCLPQQDRLIVAQDILTNGSINGQPMQSMCNSTQAVSSQNYNMNGSSTNTLTPSLSITSNSSTVVRDADASHFNNALETQNNGCYQNVSPCQFFKPASNYASHIEDLERSSDKNRISPNNLPVVSNNHNPTHSSPVGNHEWASRCKKDIDTSRIDFTNDYLNCIHFQNVINESGIEERFLSSNSSSVNESIGNFPSINNEETPEYPVMLTLSSQASDSEDDLDGEAVFRRLFS